MIKRCAPGDIRLVLRLNQLKISATGIDLGFCRNHIRPLIDRIIQGGHNVCRCILLSLAWAHRAQLGPTLLNTPTQRRALHIGELSQYQRGLLSFKLSGIDIGQCSLVLNGNSGGLLGRDVSSLKPYLSGLKGFDITFSNLNNFIRSTLGGK